MADYYDINDDLFNILKIIRSDNVGPVTFFNLLKLYKTPKNILANIPKLAANGGNKSFKIASDEKIHAEIENTTKFGAKIISFLSPLYPQALKNIYDPPPVIIIKGSLELLQRKSISIVGSRNASINGLRITHKITKELAECGYVCISGLALGIDTEVHKASIDSGTIAVIGGGINNIYPPENNRLFDDIFQKGLIISELAYGSNPSQHSFPRRNRIIAALSLATIVIEATRKSGSLITARCALEYGKEIFAIPGFPLDPRSQGTNHLIKNGAHLLESVEDITQILNIDNYSVPLAELENQYHFEDINISDTEVEQMKNFLLNKVGYNPVSLEDILRYSDVNYKIILTAILELELANKIQRHPGNQISLILKE
jgi:DNA processing protein